MLSMSIENIFKRVCAICIAGAVCIGPQTFAYGQPMADAAPLNPEFVEYMDKLNNKPDFGPSSAKKSRAGRVPSPVEISGSYQKLRASAALPVRFDLREEGRQTPVKDQGNLGSCWTFGNTAALESSLLPGEEWDFSENNLLNNNGFEGGRDAGGNGDMAAAYYIRWAGPVGEADDPYTEEEFDSSPASLDIKKHVQDIYFVPREDRELIKKMIMDYGAISTGVLGADPENNAQYYNEEAYAFYCPDEDAQTDHEINIIGWDDNFPKEHFTIKPEGDGAYICRNSWGDYWGEGGYFYVSYYDTTIATGNTVYAGVEDVSNYEYIYQHDEYGATGYMGYGEGENWFANVFQAEYDQQVKAAGFYTKGMNSEYEVYAAADYHSEDDLSNMTKVGEGVLKMPGYHTVDMGETVNVKAGGKFAIAVRIVTPDEGYPIPVEENIEGYLSAASANASESFISGGGDNWSDLAEYDEQANVCLKAYADNVKEEAKPFEWDDSGYEIWSPKKNVGALKDWTIDFSGKLDAKSINSSSILVFDKLTGQSLPVEAAISDDGSKVTARHPGSGYEKGKTYILEIGKDVMSDSGKKLQKPLRMEFTVEN
ncbi:Cysteine protease, C1A family [Peptoclostridium litorale DSM 5388]|uniref:Surface layer protein B n=2 Tax=Peptoclostridium litorale TaxID=1557 RepID=A0A069RD14_PEPLI|nr:surface layer protein B [Peptoclostridium litorale DSM 5388]SIO33727.1 Cysteine protease, C1A family [Peptoclostridium litorale DSM 5388]